MRLRNVCRSEKPLWRPKGVARIIFANSDVKERPRSPLSTWVISLFLAGIIISAAYLWLRYESEFPRTEDAELSASLLWIAPQISGEVTAVRVRPDQAVKAGDILFEIDQNPSKAVSDGEEEIADLEHSGAVAKARMPATRAEKDQAAKRLGRTVVRAPSDGYATDLDLKEGDYVHAGERLFPLVKSGGWFVKASFEEHELEYVRPGMPAEVKVDRYRGITFDGIVTAIDPASATSTPLLPPQNAEGNQELTRRDTVHIHLPTWDPEHPFPLGARCEVEINIRVKPSKIARER